MIASGCPSAIPLCDDGGCGSMSCCWVDDDVGIMFLLVWPPETPVGLVTSFIGAVLLVEVPFIVALSVAAFVVADLFSKCKC